jgi:hypothetical protein
MGTPAPVAVKRLVDHFDQVRKVFISGDYKEGQLPKAATQCEQEFTSELWKGQRDEEREQVQRP